MSILRQIVEKKRERLDSAKAKVSVRELKARLQGAPEPRDFMAAVRRGSGNIRLIAEIKKASPSKGLLNRDFEPAKFAFIYEEKAVDAISVITEEDFFQGSLDYLPAVRGITTRPVLRKDFIFDEYQIYEARVNNGDAILLIASVLSRGQAGEYLHLSRELGMSVLFEVHDFKELDTALSLNAGIIGINNRDLKTMTTDIGVTLKLKKEIPEGRVVVSESGIGKRADVLQLENAGIDAMLVGTSLMLSVDIRAKIDELRGRDG